MKKFFVGIDFSKRRMDVSIVEKDFPEQTIDYKQFINNAEGAKEMCEWVEYTTNTSTKLEGEVLFCCEHTGSYCLEVCDYLSENGKYIWLGNPLDPGQAKRHPGLRGLIALTPCKGKSILYRIKIRLLPLQGVTN